MLNLVLISSSNTTNGSIGRGDRARVERTSKGRGGVVGEVWLWIVRPSPLSCCLLLPPDLTADRLLDPPNVFIYG